MAIRTREMLSLTQKDMGERLLMSESSYSDIETGHHGCSMLTAILLLEMQSDPKQCLDDIARALAEGASHKESQA